MVRRACAKVTAAMAALLVAVAFQAPSRAGSPVAGDQAAWQEVTAALRKLEGTSYRMNMIAPGQTVITEYAPPDSTRVTTLITGEPGEIETITVGNQVSSRVTGPDSPGAWTCGGPDRRRLAFELKDFFKMVEASRRPDSLIEGLPVHTYEIAHTVQGSWQTGQGSGQTATIRTVVYIGILTGLPRRSITSYPLGPGDVVLDYYDHGAPIVITLPPCS